jgi:hypothetical protein
MGAPWRGSGHGYYFLLRKSFGVETKNCSKIRYFQAARRLKTARRALVKELVQMARTRAVAAAFGIFSRLEVTHVS